MLCRAKLEYKFIIRQGANVHWQQGNNKGVAVPDAAAIEVTDSWGPANTTLKVVDSTPVSVPVQQEQQQPAVSQVVEASAPDVSVSQQQAPTAQPEDTIPIPPACEHVDPAVSTVENIDAEVRVACCSAKAWLYVYSVTHLAYGEALSFLGRRELDRLNCMRSYINVSDQCVVALANGVRRHAYLLSSCGHSCMQVAGAPVKSYLDMVPGGGVANNIVTGRPAGVMSPVSSAADAAQVDYEEADRMTVRRGRGATTSLCFALGSHCYGCMHACSCLPVLYHRMALLHG